MATPSEPKLLKTIETFTGDVNYCSFSPSESTIVTASGEGTVYLFDANNGQQLASSPLSAHNTRYYVNICEFSPDGKMLVTAGSDHAVKIWDAATWKEIGSITDHTASVKCCCFSPNNRYLLTTSADKSAKLWDANSFKLLATYKRGDENVNACCMSLDGTYAVTGDSAGEICVWDIRNHALVTRTIAHDLGVNCIISGPQDLSDKGLKSWKSVFITCGNNPEVKAWKLDFIKNKFVLTKLATMTQHSNAVYRCAFAAGYEFFITGSADKSVILWKTATWSMVWRTQVHSRYVTCCAFSPNMLLMATTSNDRMLKLWDVSGGKVSSNDYNSSVSSVESEKNQKENVVNSGVPRVAVEQVCNWLETVAGQTDTDKETLALVDKLTQSLKLFDSRKT